MASNFSHLCPHLCFRTGCPSPVHDEAQLCAVDIQDNSRCRWSMNCKVRHIDCLYYSLFVDCTSVQQRASEQKGPTSLLCERGRVGYGSICRQDLLPTRLSPESCKACPQILHFSSFISAFPIFARREREVGLRMRRNYRVMC
jgi:hypothetical protein